MREEDNQQEGMFSYVSPEKRVPQLVQASSAGRMSGSAQVLLELTDIIINDTATPMLTATYEVKWKARRQPR